MQLRLAIAFLLAMSIVPVHSEEIGWPEAVAQLAGERAKAAEVCVGLLKGHGNPQQIARGQLAYGTAKGNFDAVIAGLITALGEGGTPESLPSLEAKLKTGASGLADLCHGVADLVPRDSGQKGIVADLAKSAIDPVIKALSDGVAALYNNHRTDKALTRQTIQTQLEAAKWPGFGEVKAAQ
jgi:hypothetical protein